MPKCSLFLCFVLCFELGCKNLKSKRSALKLTLLLGLTGLAGLILSADLIGLIDWIGKIVLMLRL